MRPIFLCIMILLTVPVVAHEACDYNDEFNMVYTAIMKVFATVMTNNGSAMAYQAALAGNKDQYEGFMCAAKAYENATVPLDISIEETNRFVDEYEALLRDCEDQ